MDRRIKLLGTLLLLAFLILNFNAGLVNLCNINGGMQEMSCCRTVTHGDANDSQIGPVVCDCEMAKGPAKLPPVISQSEGSCQIGKSGKLLNCLIPLAQCLKGTTPTSLVDYRPGHSPHHFHDVKIYDLYSSYLI